MSLARLEIKSLKTSVSPAGRSPPHKKARGPNDTLTREVGTQMEIVDCPDPTTVPLPTSPLRGKNTIDRGCSSVWGSGVWSSGALTAPLSRNKKVGATGVGASPPTSVSRNLTALEQSLGPN